MAVSYLRRLTKDPQAVLDYTWNWDAWLNGDTIAIAVVTPASGITLDSQTNTTTAVTAWLSGGVAGTFYDVTCHITTAAGRQDDRTIRIAVGER